MQVRNHIIANGGSIADIPDISAEMKEIYRTVWEIRQRSLIDMAADRGNAESCWSVLCCTVLYCTVLYSTVADRGRAVHLILSCRNIAHFD